MTSTDPTTEEQLDRLYREQKISGTEYERLRQSLSGVNQGDDAKLPWKKRLPWQVLVCIFLLAVAALIQIPMFLGKEPIAALVILIASGLLIYGLWNLHRWAFCLFIGICALSLMAITRSPGGVVINLISGFILLTAHQHFFPNRPRFRAKSMTGSE